MSNQGLRFVTQDKVEIEQIPWATFDWLSKPEMTRTEQLLVIRVHFPPGLGHMFHKHPQCEEVVYCLEGQVEQWVEQERRNLNPGESAHIPKNTVHATYNTTDKPAVILAIISPAKFDGPLVVDTYNEEPWKSLKAPLNLPA